MSGVPQEMQQLAQWVCWRYEERKGKITKVPVNPETGGNAASDNPDTWAPLERAWQRAKGSLGTRGIGFMLSGGYVGLDLDHVVMDAKRCTPRTQALLSQWRCTYAEYSPSGTGVHVFFRGELPLGWHKYPFDLGTTAELYSERRFFTVTGKRWSQ
jgi:putative DNA primase/helicase